MADFIHFCEGLAELAKAEGKRLQARQKHFEATADRVSAMVLRVLMVLAGMVAAGGVAWMSAPGKEFFAFAQESWAEAGRVAWPTRKETMQTTAIVFAFVVIMALFLFAVDTSLQWIIKLITGRTEG